MMDEFAAGMRDQGAVRGGELYLNRNEAIRLLEAYELHNFAVVGVEAAILKEDATIPQPDLMGDFSSTQDSDWSTFRRKCNALCREFLDELPERAGLFVTLVALAQEDVRR